jgi:hypothetical protein
LDSFELGFARLATLIYPDGSFAGRYSPLPGVRIERAIYTLDRELRSRIAPKLWQSCRKLLLAWFGSEQALAAESDFYSSTFHDAPALFGEDAISVQYHLEAFILLARSAMDISAGIFGELLPAPFRAGRFDSLNDLVKRIRKDCPASDLAKHFDDLADDPESWMSILTSLGESRSLRDKLAHQIEFPIHYVELDERSEKERPIVRLSKTVAIPLEEFIEEVRTGIIAGFTRLEDECLGSLSVRSNER